MRLLVLALGLVVAVAAQTPVYEIRGTVIETGSGPITGARVYVRRAMAPDNRNPPIETFTSARGEFSIRVSAPDRYFVYVERQGYVIDPTSSGMSSTLDPDHPRADVNVKMLRPAIATGRVIDAETREPVEGVAVALLRRRTGTGGTAGWGPVSPLLWDMPIFGEEELRAVSGSLKTDRNGVFTQTVMPLDAVAAIIRSAATQNQAGTVYDAEAFKIVDKEIDNSFWPGGVSADLVVPLPLAPGGTANFGDILLKKVPRYRVHVSIPQGDCPQGESVRIVVLKPGMPKTGQGGVFACGSEILLRGFDPGMYTLYAVSDWQGERDNIENAVWGTAEFSVVDKNVETKLVLHHGVVIEGKLTATDGLASLPESIALGVQPEPLVAGIPLQVEQFIEWLPGSRFRMAVSPRSQTLVHPPQRDAIHIRQIFYNGILQKDASAPLNMLTNTHSIEIVVSDKPPPPATPSK